MLMLAACMARGYFRLPVRFLPGPIGATILLADVFRRMGGNQRTALWIAAARIAVTTLAVARLSPCARRRGGWIGSICCGWSLRLRAGNWGSLLRRTLAARAPAALSLARLGIRLKSRYVGGTGRNIRGNIMRQHNSVTGLTVTLVFLATTGSLRFPFVRHRRPLFRRLWAVSGVDHCLVHFAAHKRRRYAAGFHKVSLGGQYQRKRF